MTVKILLKRESTEGVSEKQVTAVREMDTSDVEQVVQNITKKD